MARWIHKGPDHQLAHAVRPRYGAQTRRRGPRGLRRRRVRKGLAQAGLWAAPLSGLAGIVAAWAAVVAGWPWCLSPRRCWAQPEGSDQRPGDDQRHDVRVGECQRPEAAGDGTQLPGPSRGRRGRPRAGPGRSRRRRRAGRPCPARARYRIIGSRSRARARRRIDSAAASTASRVILPFPLGAPASGAGGEFMAMAPSPCGARLTP
jgi:hypothetical protein